MRNKTYLLLVFVLLALGAMSVLFVSACGGTTTTTAAAATTTAMQETTTTAAGATTTAAGATTTAAAATGDDIVIGAINSITGSNVLTGQDEKWAQEKAVADINAKGGVKLNDGLMHKLVLKYADDKSDPTAGAAAMEQLIKVDGLKLILSSNITPVNQAAATVAEKYGVYFDITSSWIDLASPDGSFAGFIGGMDLKWSTDFFEAAGTSSNNALGALKAMNPADLPTKFAVMTDNSPDGTGFGNANEAALKAAGYNVVTYEQFSATGTPDFSSIILKFKQLGVDGMVTLIDPAGGITFLKQMKQNDWSPKFIFGYKGFWPSDFANTLGADADYVGHDGFWSESFPYPYCKELGAAYTADHNGDTSNSVGLYYAAVQILATALERAGTAEPGAVRDQVFGGTFQGTTMGDITFGSYDPSAPGIAHIPFVADQWQPAEGSTTPKRVVIFPQEFNQGPMETFVPWNQR
jgi:branched-chain amino acid transport system substrate-binding protein